MLYEVEYQSGPNGHTLYVPRNRGRRRPGILLLHGSEGGFSGWVHVQALELAHAGFVTMPLSYARNGNAWHAGDICEVDLDDTETALAWLRNCEIVSGRVGLLGNSRGAEHALLLASLLAREADAASPEAVAAHASTDVIVAAFFASAALPRSGMAVTGGRKASDGAPIEINPKRAWRWRGTSKSLRPGAPIEIEHYSGALFLSHGEADDVWSVKRTRRLEARLVAHGREPEVHYYSDEGHRLRPEARTRHQQLLASFFSRALFTD